MKPADYTPATIAHIRSTALHRRASVIADELGWDLSRLRRVAHEWSINLIADRPTAVQSLPARMQDSPPEAKRSLLNSAMTLDEIAQALPRRQADLFRMLVNARAGGGPMSSGQLAEQLGTTVLAVKANIGNLRGNLRPTCWDVAGLKSVGYCLVQRS